MDFPAVEAARTAYLTKKSRIWRRSLTIIGVILVAATLIVLTGEHGGVSLFFHLFSMTISVMIIGCVVSATIIAFATSKDATAYRHAYKTYFVEQSLATIFTNLRYNHAAGLDEKLLRASGFINTGDVYHSNDLIAARYRDIGLIQADAHIQTKYTDSDGHTHYTTIFRGRFLLFEFPRQFSFRLELIGRKFHAAKIPKKTASGRKMTRLSTESTEFNKTFKIYAEDGFEAYYLLDPAYIDKIQSLASQYHDNLFLGFLDNVLIIGLNDGKDAFEPPRPKLPLDEQAELARISSDIKVITDLVDLLAGH